MMVTWADGARLFRVTLAGVVKGLYAFIALACLCAIAASAVIISVHIPNMSREMIIQSNLMVMQMEHSREQEFTLNGIRLQMEKQACQMDLVTAASRSGWRAAYRLMRANYFDGCGAGLYGQYTDLELKHEDWASN